MIRRYFVRHRVHRLQQHFEGEFIFRTYQEKQLIAEERSPITMSYYGNCAVKPKTSGLGFTALFFAFRPCFLIAK